MATTLRLTTRSKTELQDYMDYGHYSTKNAAINAMIESWKDKHKKFNQLQTENQELRIKFSKLARLVESLLEYQTKKNSVETNLTQFLSDVKNG